ncbi:MULTISPECIES: preprotein translocase subunit SecY [Candidatus Palauibacter]|uniref:preprotein translocase subunit SecY n=1 Tax=Candidatus Palauibacter TaxID=3056650 RepID=UPI0023A3F3AE|nr:MULTISPECIES: preprotein translocase subunit SecY [Palauibacter]MDE2721682.1 preprotein translocase subunit SecY [Candidatus Palauibacter polyketidifaciens]MDE2878267.1 preprotein translocase subunit SecY [Candidatus Palauibacter soopunensis]MDE2944730.1 preprotein translocase subunit SecY [Gemmatimonadota bacterium]
MANGQNAAAAAANIFKVPELKAKILFTLLCLALYRLGSHITTPGVNVVALQALAGQFQGTIFGIYDLFVGGGLQRATVFALGIMPYISASILFQLLAAVMPAIEKLQKEGEEGRRKLTQWTRYTTVVLCIGQSYTYALFLEAQPGAVLDPGLGFRLLTVLMLTTGGVFVMWLGEQITERGVGNGMSLLIFFSILQGFPGAVLNTFELYQAGGISLIKLAALAATLVAIMAAVVALTMAQRKIPVQIPRKVVGRGRIREGQRSFIPLRINSAGVMPIIFAQSIIIIPGTLAAFMGNPGPGSSGARRFIYEMSQALQVGTAWYYVLYVVLIVYFTYFYTSIIFNPTDLAENLKRQGGFIPGVKPGAKTADYIDHVLTRITLPGAVYLALIAVLPYLIFSIFDLQTFFFGGTSLLIVVGVALDTMQQLQQHLLLRQYEGFMKKGRVKYRGRQRYM